MRKLLILVLIFFTQLAQSQDGVERLLPESFTRSINFEWTQDGRVIDIKVTNPNGKWVLKNLTFTVHEESTSLLNNIANDSLNVLERYTRSFDLTHVLYLELQPNRSNSLHIELKPGINATGLSLDEAKGRDQTRFEKLKSALF